MLESVEASQCEVHETFFDGAVVILPVVVQSALRVSGISAYSAKKQTTIVANSCAALPGNCYTKIALTREYKQGDLVVSILYR